MFKSSIKQVKKNFNSKTNKQTEEKDTFPKLDSQLSPDCTEGIKEITEDLMTNILANDMKSYCKMNIDKKTFLCNQIPIDVIMSYSSKTISSALTKNCQLLNESACELFEHLLSYTGDIRSSTSQQEHLISFLKLGYGSSTEVKDEAYIQLVKQLTNNIDKVNYHRVWEIFSVVVSTFAPSLDLYYSVLNMLVYEVKNTIDDDVFKRSNYCIVRLIKTFENSRKSLPSDNEIKSIIEMKPLLLPIYFFNETNIIVPLESYTTINESKTYVINKMETIISKAPYFSLYEIKEEEKVFKERFLEEFDLMCDLLSNWKYEEKKQINKEENAEYTRVNYAKSSVSSSVSFKIYLKLLFFYESSFNDEDVLLLIYYQVRRDVVYGRIKISTEELVEITVIDIIINMENEGEDSQIEGYLRKNISKYMSNHVLKSVNSNELISKIGKRYKELNNIDKDSLEIEYVKRLQENPLFLSLQFNIKNKKDYNQSTIFKNLPDDLILGIEKDMIRIFDTNRNELINYELKHIASWGVNQNTIVFVIQQREDDIQKFYFICGCVSLILILNLC